VEPGTFQSEWIPAPRIRTAATKVERLALRGVGLRRHHRPIFPTPSIMP
jgi:hypothetical protein